MAERLGSAVAVMNVPVEDEHALGAKLCDRQLRRDRDIVEEAEAHSAIWFGVMPGGPHSTEAQARLVSHQRPCHLTGAAAACSGAVGGLPDVCVRVHRAATGQREFLDLLDVSCAVDQLQLGLRCRRGFGSLPAQPVTRGEGMLDRLQAIRGVRMLPHVHPRIVRAAPAAETEPGRWRGTRSAPRSQPVLTYGAVETERCLWHGHYCMTYAASVLLVVATIAITISSRRCELG